MFLLIWLLLCVLIGAWASSQCRFGFGYFLLSLFASPLVGALVLGIVLLAFGSRCGRCCYERHH